MDIRSRAVVVDVHVSTPGELRKDRAVTAEVTRSKGAARDAGRWSNRIWPEEATEPCRAQARAVKELLYAHSVPWVAEGQRLVLAGTLMDLRPKLDEGIAAFDKLAEASAERLPEWVEMARRDRGRLFNERDYPRTRADYRRLFKVRLACLPVPDAQHVICDLADDDLRYLRESVADQVADALEQGRRDVQERLAKPLRRMVERLGDADAVFRDTLVENLKEVAALVPALNLTGDAALAEAGRACADLGASSPDSLRENKAFRRRTAERAAAVLRKLEGGA